MMNNIHIIENIQEVLVEVEPMVASHSGKIQFVKFEDDIVFVRLEGACATCPASLYTLTCGIEDRLRKDFPDIKGVLPVID